jgi:hypothetical protein
LRRAGCVERRTPGSGSGPQKPTGRNTGRALRADFHHNFLHLPIGIDDALAEARGLHTSFVLAHQYLGQLSGDMVEAIDANARNKVYFALAPRDAIDQARHLRPYLDDGDLIRLGGYEIVLRPVAGGRVVPPVTADTEPPPPPIKGRSAALRAAARQHTGLSHKDRRELLGTTATVTADIDPQPSVQVPTELLVGRNTFASHGERSNETPHEPSNEEYNEFSNESEDSLENAPYDSSYPQVNGIEENW